MVKVVVIIVNWNGAKDTIKCIQSLQAMTPAAYDLSIVVIDNGSTDGSYADITAFLVEQGCSVTPCKIPDLLAERIKEAVSYAPAQKYWPTVTLVAATENNGFAGGNNIAVELYRALQAPDFIWFLNSDTEVECDALSILMEKMLHQSDVGICGSTLVHLSDRRTVQAYGGAFYSMLTGRAWAPGAGLPYDPAVTDEWVERRINYVAGAAMLVRTSVLDEVGLMSEDYFLYNEEIDLARRAAGRFRLGVATRSIVYHRVGASIGTEGSSAAASRLSTFYQTRSKLLFASKHTPMSYPLVWLTLFARGLKLVWTSCRRAEAMVIFAVIVGRRKVDPIWFAERKQQTQVIENQDTLR